MFTVLNEIRTNEDLCLDAWSADVPGEVFLQHCHGGKGNQEFRIRKVKETSAGMMSHIVHRKLSVL